MRIAVGGRIALSGQLRECEQREHNRLFALSEDFARLLLGKRRPQWQVERYHLCGIRSSLVGPLS
ncbi:MAG: hypothetical protein ACLP7Q_12270 [Isosphaeraceae bacterium]